MFKRKGGGGAKGFLNNVKKKLHFSCTEASLMAHVTVNLCNNEVGSYLKRRVNISAKKVKSNQ